MSAFSIWLPEVKHQLDEHKFAIYHNDEYICRQWHYDKTLSIRWGGNLASNEYKQEKGLVSTMPDLSNDLDFNLIVRCSSVEEASIQQYGHIKTMTELWNKLAKTKANLIRFNHIRKQRAAALSFFFDAYTEGDDELKDDAMVALAHANDFRSKFTFLP